MDDMGNEIVEKEEDDTASLNRRKDNSFHERINTNKIRSRLQQLESELSSVLNMLKSNTSGSVSEKAVS